MAHVFLIGSGPLLTPDTQQLGFPQLRLRHLLLALKFSGHQITLALLGPKAHQHVERQLWIPELGSFQVSSVDPEDSRAAETLKAQVELLNPDIIVSAGPYHPARMAALVAGERPLWVDIPGDPFAEAQARLEHDPQGEHRLWMRRAVAGAMLRGDAFGVISEAQRFALMGQLGWLGRLDPAHLESKIAVVPVSYEMGGLREQQPSMRSSMPWSGRWRIGHNLKW